MVNKRSSSNAGSRAADAATASSTAARALRSRKPRRRSSSASPPPAAMPPPPLPPSAWSHSPSRAMALWMAVSLPLVVWDTAYVLGRPHTMAGGLAHWPLWVPYTLYGQVDHVYGWKAFHARSGFPAAQAFLNLVETLLYLSYLWLCYTAAGAPSALAAGSRRPWTVTGRTGARAVLLGFSAAVMTLSNTLLYWMHEYYSGFDNVGHNPFVDLIYLYIIPNGAWLVGSAYMTATLGREILNGLEAASSTATKS